MTDRHQLKREPQPVVVTTTSRDQPPILIIQIEESLQLNPRIRPEPAITLIRHRDMKTPTRQPRSPNHSLAPDLAKLFLGPRRGVWAFVALL